MSRKAMILIAGGLVTCLVVFLSVPILGIGVLAGFFGYACTPSVYTTAQAVAAGSTASGSVASGSAAQAYFDQFTPDEQAKKKAIVAQIISIGRERKFSDRSIAIAIATAIQESNIANLPFLGNKNDHQSLGIFQQQPSKTWGTAEQIMDPVHAINAFYDGLEKVPDRDSRPMIDVAIEVQVPDPKKYHLRWHWDDIATQLVSANPGQAQCETTVASGGWQLPLKAKSYSITDGFGMRFDPVYHVTQLHDGVDLGAPENTPIYAAHSGTVVTSGWNGGFGNYVSIDNGNGILTGYGHMIAISSGITKGTQVVAGEVIGFVGSTGASTGDHLHFLLHINGKPSDPDAFMKSVGVSIESGAKG